jgi:hypothetical protein
MIVINSKIHIYLSVFFYSLNRLKNLEQNQILGHHIMVTL